MTAEEFMIPCLIKAITGFDCPGCGAQRSFWLLLNGEFSEAFQAWPAIYTMLIFSILAVIAYFDGKHTYKLPLTVLTVLNVVIILATYFLKLFSSAF
ncbi:Protein of unknown function [Cruoricaptor ignavus]|uniref:DUF2752 domain-containing protein n=1 Tax=Cruoricaptor ignavus TaxID=1118202 RepID=A0A1M6GKG4_9FLAO|nr:DUF2752 domain-containing protein [Cruoricaptor ignavus]SHJ10435.1 Protein of unknown function [Cruoricaptor ignavus]